MLTIIIEGVDRLGKTTLQDGLACKISNVFAEFGELRHVHCTYPPKGLTQSEQIEFQRNTYLGELNYLSLSYNQDKINIYDRFLMGERIYGPKYRGYTPDYIHDFEEKLDIDSTYLVVLTGSEELVRSRFDNNFIKIEDIGTLLETYRNEYELSHVQHKMLLDVEKLTPEDVVNAVYNFIYLGLIRHKISLMRLAIECHLLGLPDWYRSLYNIIDGDSTRLKAISLMRPDLTLHGSVKSPSFVRVKAGAKIGIVACDETRSIEDVPKSRTWETLDADHDGELVAFDETLYQAYVKIGHRTCMLIGDQIKNINFVHSKEP
jgi:thymidylate kinase